MKKADRKYNTIQKHSKLQNQKDMNKFNKTIEDNDNNSITSLAAENQSTSTFSWRKWFLLPFLFVSIILCGYFALPTIETVATSIPVTKTVKELVHENIEDITIGDRVLGKNPVLSDKDRQLFGPEPTPETHQEYVLLLPQENDSATLVRLLRPKDWLNEDFIQVVEVDSEPDKNGVIATEEVFLVWLELPEMGAIGWAKLVGIVEYDEFKQGKGNIVTGTFCHLANNVINLKIEGQDPIGCTDNHPFWSVDRQDYIDAGKLYDGERILLYNGETKRVVQKLPRPGPEVVYNIEVFGEHVYYVGENGTLVHNSCHPNSAESKLVNYGYAIIDTATGTIRKFGITMSAIGKNGLPQRTTRQLKKGETGILLGTFKNRAEALKWEHEVVGMFRAMWRDPILPGNKRPKGVNPLIPKIEP